MTAQLDQQKDGGAGSGQLALPGPSWKRAWVLKASRGVMQPQDKGHCSCPGCEGDGLYEVQAASPAHRACACGHVCEVLCCKACLRGSWRLLILTNKYFHGDCVQV